MRNIQKMDKMRAIFKNPISVFGIIAVILTLILAFGTHMHVPDFYTNKEFADKIAQEVKFEDIYTATEHLITPNYYIWNGLFQAWAWVITFVAFCLIFKVYSFERFKDLKVLNRKLFAYLWINISYPIFGHCFLYYYIIDLDKYVYNHSADSMGIPFFGMYIFLIMLAVIYYPLSNFLVLMTYNTRVRRAFYNFLWVISLLVILLTAFACFNMHFSYLCFALYPCILIWFIFSIYAIGYKENKLVGYGKS